MTMTPDQWAAYKDQGHQAVQGINNGPNTFSDYASLAKMSPAEVKQLFYPGSTASAASQPATSTTTNGNYNPFGFSLPQAAFTGQPFTPALSTAQGGPLAPYLPDGSVNPAFVNALAQQGSGGG
jgi:hypothetical protein